MNAFEIFGLAPTPWLDQDALKKRYLKLSAKLHPDANTAPPSDSFTELQNAYLQLSSDRLRLLLLLKIRGEQDVSTIGAVPTHLADFFMNTSGLLRASDRLLQQRAEAGSFLEKASLQEESLEKSDALQTLLTEFLALRAQLQVTLQSADLNDTDLLKTSAVEFSYLDRWIEQVQEKMFLLVA